MAARVGVSGAGERTALEMAARSRSALDRALQHDASLAVSVASDEALLLGAFQRAHGMPEGLPLARRGSGGPEVRIGPGTIHVALSLSRPGVIAGADAKRIVNRAVRPLLRALTKTGHTAHFFGRDWVSVAHRPAAWVGFAHDAGTRRTLFEAFVAVSTPFAVVDRRSFVGKEHGTLESIGGRAVDPARVAAAIADAYAEGHETFAIDDPAAEPAVAAAEDLRADPPWAATCEEAIGTLGAGPDARGVFRVGGDWLVSRDAVAALERAIAAEHPPQRSAPDAEAVGRAVDEALGAERVALEGVRSLVNVRDVILRALRV
jgi:hypothetical protein